MSRLPKADASVPGPLPVASRNTGLDQLRGLAVLGILPVNIQLFAMPYASLANPTVWGASGGLDGLAWWVLHLGFQQKFLTLFALLFGAGIALQRQHLLGGPSPRVAHRRRMMVLLAVGMLHAYFLWYGDILAPYAVCGFLLWPVVGWAPGQQSRLALLLFCVPAVTVLLYWSLLPLLPDSALAGLSRSWQPPLVNLLQEGAAYRGGWWAQLPQRARQALELQTLTFGLESGWRIAGAMCLGMAMWQAGWLQRRAWRSRRMLALALVTAGLLITALGAARNIATGWSVPAAPLPGSQPLYWGSLLTALGYLGLVLASEGRGKLGRALQGLGRTALSNYLLQSLLCYMLFHGCGLALFGRVERGQLLLMVLAIWATQTLLTLGWLARFQRGPAEALLRRVVYRD